MNECSVDAITTGYLKHLHCRERALLKMQLFVSSVVSALSHSCYIYVYENQWCVTSVNIYENQ